MPTAQVRIIDTSAGAPDLDIYQGSLAMAYNLGFGTVSSYVSVPPGTLIVSAHSAGTKQQLGYSRGSFAASGHYTVLLTEGATGSVSETVLTDQSTPSPAGLASVRVIDQARRGSGAVDIYLARAGTAQTESRPLMSKVGFGENSGNVNVPAGAYRVIVVVPGTTVPIYSGATIAFSSGSAQTLVLLDSQRIDGQRLQVMTAEDFNPVSVTE